MSFPCKKKILARLRYKTIYGLTCLVNGNINGKQLVKLEEGTIEFENYSKQIPVPFKIYADFKCNLRGVESYEDSYTKEYRDHVSCNFAYKVVCIDDRFTKPIVVYRG